MKLLRNILFLPFLGCATTPQSSPLPLETVVNVQPIPRHPLEDLLDTAHVHLLQDQYPLMDPEAFILGCRTEAHPTVRGFACHGAALSLYGKILESFKQGVPQVKDCSPSSLKEFDEGWASFTQALVYKKAMDEYIGIAGQLYAQTNQDAHTMQLAQLRHRSDSLDPFFIQGMLYFATTHRKIMGPFGSCADTLK